MGSRLRRRILLQRWKFRCSVFGAYPKFRTRRIRNSFRHDADDHRAFVVQWNRAADDRRVAAKALLPQLMTQHGDARWFVLLKPSSENWLNAERIEERGRNDLPEQAFRLFAAGEVETP